MSSPLQGKSRHPSPGLPHLGLVSTPRSSQGLGEGSISEYVSESTYEPTPPRKLVPMSSPLQGKSRHTSPGLSHPGLVSTPRSSQGVGEGSISEYVSESSYELPMTPRKLVPMSSPLGRKSRHTSPTLPQPDLVGTLRSSQGLGDGNPSGSTSDATYEPQSSPPQQLSQALSSNYNWTEADVVAAARPFLHLMEDFLGKTIGGIENVEITWG